MSNHGFVTVNHGFATNQSTNDVFERSEFGFRYSVRKSVFVIPHGTQLTFIHSELGVRYSARSSLWLFRSEFCFRYSIRNSAFVILLGFAFGYSARSSVFVIPQVIRFSLFRTGISFRSSVRNSVFVIPLGIRFWLFWLEFGFRDDGGIAERPFFPKQTGFRVCTSEQQPKSAPKLQHSDTQPLSFNTPEASTPKLQQPKVLHMHLKYSASAVHTLECSFFRVFAIFRKRGDHSCNLPQARRSLPSVRKLVHSFVFSAAFAKSIVLAFAQAVSNLPRARGLLLPAGRRASLAICCASFPLSFFVGALRILASSFPTAFAVTTS